MKNHRSMLAGLVAGVAALAFSSCAYDPYYSGGASYSSGGGGYGNGYGYGGSSFSTTFFVSTGSPRWGYDPYAGAYYDYTRRCYYDPHLYGYYPVGYRPRYVYGAPHPHGWRRGYSSIAPPSRIRSYNLTNYQDRTSRYRDLDRDWSRNVRTAPAGRDQHSGPEEYRDRRSRPDRSELNQGGFNRGSEAVRDRGERGRADAFGGRNTSVTAPQVPDTRRGDIRRGGGSPDREARRQDIERMNEGRERGSDRRERPSPPQMQQPQPEPQFERQPQPERQPSQDGGRERGGFRRDSGGDRAQPSGEGDGGGRRERGMRGLGEG